MNLIDFVREHKLIYVFGKGKNGSKLKRTLNENGFKVKAYIDNSISGDMVTKDGIDIIYPSKVSGGIIISVLSCAVEIKQQLLDLGVSENDIYIPSEQELIPPSFITEDENFIYHYPIDGK